MSSKSNMLAMKVLPKPEEMVRFDKEYMEGYFQALGAVRELISREITLQELYEALIDSRQMIYDKKCRVTGESRGLLWQ
jgi:hypothetical protein